MEDDTNQSAESPDEQAADPSAARERTLRVGFDQVWCDERSRRIWREAEELVRQAGDPTPGIEAVVQAYEEAVEKDPENATLLYECALSLGSLGELVNEALRTAAVTLLEEALARDPENERMAALLKLYRRPSGLVARAAHREAGHAVAEHLLGRILVRVNCELGVDRVSLQDLIVRQPASLRLGALGEQIFFWLKQVDRWQDEGKMTPEEAQAARADLWAPFLALQRGAPEEAAPRRLEEEHRKDLVALLAGGEAERRFTGERTNSCLAAATELSRALPEEEQARALSWAYSCAEALIETHWGAIEALAAAMVAEPELDGPRAVEVIEGALRCVSAGGPSAP
jgi:hypothetical protein